MQRVRKRKNRFLENLIILFVFTLNYMMYRLMFFDQFSKRSCKLFMSRFNCLLIYWFVLLFLFFWMTFWSVLGYCLILYFHILRNEGSLFFEVNFWFGVFDNTFNCNGLFISLFIWWRVKYQIVDRDSSFFKILNC